MATTDLDERVEAIAEIAEKRVDLDARDKAYGGLVPSDRQREERSRSMAGWGPYRSEASKDDISGETKRSSALRRRVELAALWIDCGAACRRIAPHVRKQNRELLQQDAVIWIVERERYAESTARPIDLGARGQTPLLRDWRVELSEEERKHAPRGRRDKLTDDAWRVLTAAVRAAARAPELRAELEASEREQATDCDDLDALMEEEQLSRQDGESRAIPSSAELVASLLNVPLDAARAIVARSLGKDASVTDLALSWQISESTCKVSLSRGAAAIRKRYPNALDLLDALDAAGADYRRVAESDAVLSLAALRGGELSEERARAAVMEWRSSVAPLSDAQRALIGAIRTALAKSGAGYGSQRAETIAGTIARQLNAESQRAKRDTRRGWSALRAAPVEPALPIGNLDTAIARTAAPVERVPRELRALDYRRAAQLDRRERVPELSEPIPQRAAPSWYSMPDPIMERYNAAREEHWARYHADWDTKARAAGFRV